MRLLRALVPIQKSLFDAENTLKDVKCQLLLVCPLWLQIYVLIVNSPVEYYCFYYRKDLITYDFLLIFPQLFTKFRYEILYELCKVGALHDLIKLQTHFEWSQDDVRKRNNALFSCVCQEGRLAVAKWLFTTFQLTATDVRWFDNYAFRIACYRGRLDTAKWLYTTFHLTIDDVRWCNDYVFKVACQHGHLNTAKWLYSVCQLTINDVKSINDAFTWARDYGQRDVCNWLVATFGDAVIA